MVIVVLLLTGLTGIAHGTPYNATTLFSVPALHAIYWGSAPPPPAKLAEPPCSTLRFRSLFYWGSAPPPPAKLAEPPGSTSLCSSLNTRCFDIDGGTPGRADLAAAARAIAPATSIFSVPHTGFQPCFSLLEAEPGTLTTLLDIETPLPAPFPPVFLLLASGFAGLGFVPKKALKRAADRMVSRTCRMGTLLPAGPSFEDLSRCSRK